MISELKEKVILSNGASGERTPLKLNRSHANVTLNTPKTPKTPLFGKENQSPLMTFTADGSTGIVRIRNN